MKCIHTLAKKQLKRRILPTLFLVIAASMFSTACSIFGVESVEEAPYKTTLKDNHYEVREYAPYVVAQTSVRADYKDAGNKAFRKLFAYISGDNEASEKIAMTAPVIAENKNTGSSEKIAMTAPVISQQDGNAWVYQFVLPKNFTIDSAPRPLNPEVALAEVEQQRVATIRYSGFASQTSRTKNTDALLRWIEAEGLVPQSEPRWAGYNAPWALPWLRRNEVLIDVATP